MTILSSGISRQTKAYYRACLCASCFKRIVEIALIQAAEQIQRLPSPQSAGRGRAVHLSKGFRARGALPAGSESDAARRDRRCSTWVRRPSRRGSSGTRGFVSRQKRLRGGLSIWWQDREGERKSGRGREGG